MTVHMKYKSNIKCYCGADAVLRSNAVLYNGKQYGNGWAYVCSRFPKCRGSVGTHPDGRPLGTIADDDTKEWRKKAHAVVDPLWKSGKYKRGVVYAKLSKEFGKQVHIGEATVEDCKKIVNAIERV